MDQRSYCVKCHQPIAFCLMWGGHEKKDKHADNRTTFASYKK